MSTEIKYNKSNEIYGNELEFYYNSSISIKIVNKTEQVATLNLMKSKKAHETYVFRLTCLWNINYYGSVIKKNP